MKLPEIKNNHLFAVLILAVLLLGGIQIYQVNRQTELLKSLIISPRGGNPGQKMDDPYERSVKNQVLKSYPEISGLYKKFLAKNPPVKKGNIVVDFTIDTDGKPLNPQVVASDFNDSELSKGIISVIAKITFPEPVAKRYMSHTFSFREEK